ncbi:MAG: PQQ-like beta-propeller repeat protein [Planctomycetes bacterium]|nr:PQQ-like beta-propeller repeat protein [Planctomycetota bacterium]
MMRKTLAATGWTLLLFTVAGADDWTQFRGPGRDAVLSEKGLLENFPAEGLKIRWRVPAGGGFSSPVIAQGRVYLHDSTSQPPKAGERLRCFDEKTGALLWTHSYQVNYDENWVLPKMLDGPRATPVVNGGRLYSAGADGDLLCVDAVRGTEIWRRTLAQDYVLDSNRTCTPSPLIEGNLLIQVLGGKPEACVVAFDKDSGKEVWRALGDRWTYSSPIVIEAGGKRQLIVWTAQAVTSLDPRTGKTFWRELADLENGPSIVATPVVQGNLLLVSGMMFRLDPDKPAATLIWPESKAPAKRVWSGTSTPLLRGDHVYAERSSGMLVCLDARSGEVVWRSDQATAVKNGATLHFYPNGDSVWMFSDQGILIRAQLTPQGYCEKSRTLVLEPSYLFGGRKVVWTPPSFANRHLFARNEQEMVCASLEAAPE